MGLSLAPNPIICQLQLNSISLPAVLTSHNVGAISLGGGETLASTRVSVSTWALKAANVIGPAISAHIGAVTGRSDGLK